MLVPEELSIKSKEKNSDDIFTITRDSNSGPQYTPVWRKFVLQKSTIVSYGVRRCVRRIEYKKAFGRKLFFPRAFVYISAIVFSSLFFHVSKFRGETAKGGINCFRMTVTSGMIEYLYKVENSNVCFVRCVYCYI